MTLIRYNPTLEPLRRLGRLQGDLLRSFENPYRVDDGLRATSDEDGYAIRLEIPGTAPEDIEVETRASLLTVAISETVSSGDGEVEKQVGFSRSVRLPNDADLERVEARYVHGVLSIRVPKKEAAKPRQIEVDVS